jgi:hypothetical protein
VIEGWEEARDHPAVIFAELSVIPGCMISPLRKSSDRAGLVVIGVENSRAAEKLAHELVASVQFTVKPDETDDPTA